MASSLKLLLKTSPKMLLEEHFNIMELGRWSDALYAKLLDIGDADDDKVLISANDTISGYLNGKLVAGSNITLTESAVPNRTLTIASSASAFTTNFYGTMSGNTSLTTAVWAKIAFDTATTDTASEFNATTDLWTCKTAGTYIINAMLRFTANATGFRGVFVSLNGDTSADAADFVCVCPNSGATYAGRAPITVKMGLALDDTIEIYGLQTSGGDLSCLAAGSYFQIWRIA